MTTAALKETVEITETVEETVLEETVLEETIETVTQETEADAFESSLGEESDRTELYSYKTFATEVSSAPVQNSFHRFGSDFCILQNRRRIIKGFDCTQKRHTNVGDTPYNTEPFNQGKDSRHSSFTDRSTVIFQSQSSLGELSLCSDLGEITENDNIFSIQEASQSTAEAEESGYDTEEELSYPASV